MGATSSSGRPRWLVIGGVLVVLAAVALAGIVWLGPEAEGTGEPGVAFTDVAEERGFDYQANNYRQKGNSRAGVYVADVDNDGDPDILATGGDDPVLFTNTGGAFEPAAEFPQFNATINAALFFDKDGDGWEDLMLFPRLDHPIYLENEGGTFEQRDTGLGDLITHVPVAASAADYDHDGCLDVFVAQNGNWRNLVPKKELLAQSQEGLPQTTDLEFAQERREQSESAEGADVPAASEWAPRTDNGNPNFLLEGDCAAGGFDNVTADVGISGERWSMAVSFADLTGNGYPDVHEANDFNFDFLWVNQNGTGFERRLIPDTNRHAMSSELADFSGNGNPDLFVTNIRIHEDTVGKKGLTMVDNSGNNLLVNENGTFTSEETAYQVREGGWGWAAATLDFQNDGETDLVQATHHMGTIHEVRLTPPKTWIRDGAKFRPVNATELGFGGHSGRGVAVLDYNRDGRSDVVVSAMDEGFRLYENQGGGGNWLQIETRTADGAHALGAEVTVRAERADEPLVKHLFTTAQADLLAQDTKVHHVGLGAAGEVTIEVTYPDGETRTYEGIDPNQRVALYPDGSLETVPPGEAG